MQSFRSHQLQKIGKELHPLATTRELSELEAQELLFQISKMDEPADQHDHFIKEMIKNSPYRKTYEKIALSLPKPHKRESGVDLAGGRVTRNSEHNSSGQSVGITSYLVVGARSHSRRHSEVAGESTERGYVQSIQQQSNRKAKHLFRLRNRNKLPLQKDNRPEAFYSSFYCSKIHPTKGHLD